MAEQQKAFYEIEKPNQWFCIEHINLSSNDDFCEACAKLPKGLQQEIITFREKLNR